MSAGGAFGGSRGLAPKPPEKGVFPLDHFGECTAAKERYMACLKEEEDSAKCSDLARAYLQCRMDRDLMAKQSLHELGFMEGTSTARTTQPSDTAADRQSEGFIAGTGQRERRAAQGQELPPLKRGH